MSETTTSEHSVEHSTKNRPLSPHLQVYNPQITSMTSIFHRISGSILAIGNVFLVIWLYGLAFSIDTFNGINGFLTSWLGIIFLMGWTAAFWYHFFAGIRHLGWDFGYGFELKTAYKTAYITFIATAIFTLITWIGILF